MPKITEVYLIENTPERFLENCSPTELREIDHLIQAPRFQVRMQRTDPDVRPANYPDINDVIDPIPLNCH